MAETIMHNLKVAAAIARDPERSGNWPISPRITDPDLMAQYAQYLAQTGSADARVSYEDLSKKLAALGIALPSLESDG